MFKEFMKFLFKIAWRNFINAPEASKKEAFWNDVCCWFQYRNYA